MTETYKNIPENVIRAARRCFAQYGIERVRMDDIAKEAGMGRTSLYRLGVTKTQLSDASILHRLSEIALELKVVVEQDLPLEELIIETSVAIIDRARSDNELHALLAPTRAIELSRLLVGKNPLIHNLALTVMHPVIQRAQEQGLMRCDVSNDIIIDWIRGIYLMFILREDLSPESEREMIRAFLVRSLMPVKP